MYGISYFTIVELWEHVFKTHLDSNDYSTYDFFVKSIDECMKSQCLILSRRTLNETEYDFGNDNNNYNNHIKQKLLTGGYYQYIFDGIHADIYHTKHQRNEIKKQTIKYDEIKEEEKYDNRKHTNDEGEGLIEYDNMKYTNFTSLIEMVELNELKVDNYKDINDEDDSITNEQDARYVSDIGSFGFGLDHSHKHLGPPSNITCFKHELLSCGYINESKWNNYLNTAMNKFKRLINTQNSRYLSKQYSADYGIVRNEMLGVHHILAILIYTSETKLCTEYRSCFRSIYPNETEKSIIS
eukprot:497647_1